MQFTAVPQLSPVIPSSAYCYPRMVPPDPFAEVSQYMTPICPVNQNVVIIVKQTPYGTGYIPIDGYLSSRCRNFYRRGENDGNEYALAEIYVVMMSECGFIGMRLHMESRILSELQSQLTGANFANSPWGHFTRLVSQLHRRVRVSRQSTRLLPLQPEQQSLEDAIIEHLRPWYQENASCPGYYTMEISLLAYGGYVLPTYGTPLELLSFIRVV